jgi:hypothetical protein
MPIFVVNASFSLAVQALTVCPSFNTYLKKQVNSTDSQRYSRKAYSSEFCMGASLLPDINRSR